MRVVLDFLIGWNQSHADRAEVAAAKFREREARYRHQYDQRYLRASPWRP